MKFVRKVFDMVWIEGLLYKLFTDLGINGRTWLVIKECKSSSTILKFIVQNV